MFAMISWCFSSNCSTHNESLQVKIIYFGCLRKQKLIESVRYHKLTLHFSSNTLYTWYWLVKSQWEYHLINSFIFPPNMYPILIRIISMRRYWDDLNEYPQYIVSWRIMGYIAKQNHAHSPYVVLGFFKKIISVLIYHARVLMIHHYARRPQLWYDALYGIWTNSFWFNNKINLCLFMTLIMSKLNVIVYHNNYCISSFFFFFNFYYS